MSEDDIDALKREHTQAKEDTAKLAKDVEKLERESKELEHPKGAVLDPEALEKKTNEHAAAKRQLDEAKKREEALDRLLDDKATPNYHDSINAAKGGLERVLGGLISQEEGKLKELKKDLEREKNKRPPQYPDRKKIEEFDKRIDKESRILDGKRQVKDRLFPPKAGKGK
jgi:hypothetical protein